MEIVNDPVVVETGRSVVLTWPRPILNRAAPGAGIVCSRDMDMRDAETDEQLVDALRLSLVIGSRDGWSNGALEVDIDRLVGADGEPLASRQLVPTRSESGEETIASRTFRYTVAEMRLADGSR